MRLRGGFLAIFMRTPAMSPAHWPKTEAFEQSRRERKKVEMCFAHMKRIFKLDRLRLRGLSGAKDEVLLTATAQNLRRLVKFLCRPPPSAAVTCTA
jgi:IS5 family transposase